MPLTVRAVRDKDASQKVKHPSFSLKRAAALAVSASTSAHTHSCPVANVVVAFLRCYCRSPVEQQNLPHGGDNIPVERDSSSPPKPS